MTTFRFLKASRSLTIQHRDDTCPNTMPRENEPSREINAKANPPVVTLKRVMSHVDIVSSGLLCSYPYTHPSFRLSCSLPVFSPSLPLSLFSVASTRVVFGALHAEDPSELASLVRISQTLRCFPRGGAKSEDSWWWDERKVYEEKERRAMELDGMVKRAEDGRCLVVCRIWVSDLGLRPAVGRLVRQETCFLGRLSLSFPPRPTFRPCALFSVPLTPFLPMSRRAAAPFATLRSSLSRELKTPRIVPECDFHSIVRSNGEV